MPLTEGREKEKKVHIVLYILDSLRADHLGCYGYKRDTSINIDAIAHDGIVFEKCFASTTWTRPVAASILTGTYPAVHRTRSRYDMFSTNLTRLPEALSAVGFRTAAFTTMGNIASEIGFDRGFDRYFDLFREPSIVDKRRKIGAAEEGLVAPNSEEVALPWAEDVNDYAIPWISSNRDRNTFSFIWSVETHVPYVAPEQFRPFSNSSSVARGGEGEIDDVHNATSADRQRIKNLYDNVIFYNDYCIGQMVDSLRSLGLYDETLLIIAGDHGDAFF